ncbi:hypothetical protein AB3S75_008943 [Citrus x aurantiifolia]
MRERGCVFCIKRVVSSSAHGDSDLCCSFCPKMSIWRSLHWLFASNDILKGFPGWRNYNRIILSWGKNYYCLLPKWKLRMCPLLFIQCYFDM